MGDAKIEVLKQTIIADIEAKKVMETRRAQQMQEMKEKQRQQAKKKRFDDFINRM